MTLSRAFVVLTLNKQICFVLHEITYVLIKMLLPEFKLNYAVTLLSNKEIVI